MSMLTPRGSAPPQGSRAGGAGGRAIGLLVSVLLIVALAAGAWWFLVRPTPAKDTGAPCPTRSVAAPTPIRPVAPKAVRVNVYNSTNRAGLAARTAGDLRARGFIVLKVANDPLHRHVTGAAELRHSTYGVAAAETLAAQIGAVVDVPDARKDASVDVVLGAAYTALRTPAQAAAALKAKPKPVTPTSAATC